MTDLPFVFDLNFPDNIPSYYDRHIKRTLSSMKGLFLDVRAYNQMLSQEDALLYEVYEIKRPELEGELLSGISVVHQGTVGNEYFMTKGHFHSILETGEVYYCLRGEGRMVMETPEGGWAVEILCPGRVLYVPPRWAHRSVNTSKTEDLITFFVYPGNAGHDYRTIEKQGFRKLVVDTSSGVQIIDNPRWCPKKECE